MEWMREWDDGGLVARRAERGDLFVSGLATGNAVVGRGKRYGDKTFDDDGIEERGMLRGYLGGCGRRQRWH